MERLSFAQGLYFFVTGIWPLISIRTFLKVTGPKTDLWLVKTVGALIAVVGLVLMLAGAQGNVTFATGVLAVGSAAALAAVDINYALKGVISKIYLLDAIIEALIIAAWILLSAGRL